MIDIEKRQACDGLKVVVQAAMLCPVENRQTLERETCGVTVPPSSRAVTEDLANLQRLLYTRAMMSLSMASSGA